MALYHIAIIFMTESNPRGGWWFSTDKDRGGLGRTDERKFLCFHIKVLTGLAKDAVTMQMFMLTCAVNLLNPKYLGMIFYTVNV